jgi:hypothetical protein
MALRWRCRRRPFDGLRVSSGQECAPPHAGVAGPVALPSVATGRLRAAYRMLIANHRQLCWTLTGMSRADQPDPAPAPYHRLDPRPAEKLSRPIAD